QVLFIVSDFQIGVSQGGETVARVVVSDNAVVLCQNADVVGESFEVAASSGQQHDGFFARSDAQNTGIPFTDLLVLQGVRKVADGLPHGGHGCAHLAPSVIAATTPKPAPQVSTGQYLSTAML